MVTVYGIPGCDRVRAARKWLAEQAIHYHFHDTRADGLPRTRLEAWCAALGMDALLNRRSTTWRQLPEAARSGLTETATIDLILAHPTLLKRPLLEADGSLVAGFDAAAWTRTLKE